MIGNEPAVTLDQILAWDPCYERAEIERLAAGRERITAEQALDLPIPAADRLWLVVRPEFLSADQIRRFVARCQVRAQARLIERFRAEPQLRQAPYLAFLINRILDCAILALDQPEAVRWTSHGAIRLARAVVHAQSSSSRDPAPPSGAVEAERWAQIEDLREILADIWP